MATIATLTKDFDGTDGATATQSGIGANPLTGAAVSTYNAAHAVSGTAAWKLVCTANTGIATFPIGSSKALVWISIYGTTDASLPAAAETLLTTFGDSNTNQAVSVRWMTDGSVQLRDNITAHTGSQSPAATLPANTDYRIAVKSNPGGTCRVRLYVDTNKHGATPDWDSGDIANTSTAATGVDTVKVGVQTSTTGTYYFDRLRGDDASEPAPAITVGPPTVNVGPDQTKDVSSGNFTITESDTTVGSATITGRSWTQVSGPALSMSNILTATVTITALAVTGTAVVRCTVTDSNGATASDDVTLSFVSPGVILEPVGDISNGGSWVNQAAGTTNLWQAIDEPVTDLTDYVTTPQSPSSASLKERMTTAVTPGNTTGWSLPIVLAITTDVTSYSVVVKVYDGDGTLKKTFAAITTGLSTTPTEVDLSFSSAEIASFAHWDSGIEVEILATAS